MINEWDLAKSVSRSRVSRDMLHYWLLYILCWFLIVEMLNFFSSVCCFSLSSSLKSSRQADKSAAVNELIAFFKQFSVLVKYFLSHDRLIKDLPLLLQNFAITFGGRIKTVLHGKESEWVTCADCLCIERLGTVVNTYSLRLPNADQIVVSPLGPP